MSSSKSSKQTPALESHSTTTSRDAESAAWIRAEIARAKEITARLEQIEHAAKISSPSKQSSGTTATVGSAKVFYYATPFDKAFLGTVDDSSKLAHFSLVARDQLMQFDAQTSKTSKINNKSVQLEVTLGRLDREAGLLVLKYINDSDIHHPKPLTYDLLPANSTLAFRCRVVNACNAFRIPHQLCGQAFRDRLSFDIRHLSSVTFADFQLVCHTVAHDPGLMNVMQNKVAYHTLRGWITEHQLACIWEYVNKCDAVRGCNYVERIEWIFQKLQAEATTRGKAYQSGWCAVRVAPPAQSSVTGPAVVMPARPSNMTVQTAEKAPVVSTNAAAQQSLPGQAVVVPTGPKNMTVATAEKAALGSTQATAGDHGAHVHLPQSKQPSDLEITFVRPSTAGPPLKLSSLPKPGPTALTSKAHTPIPKLTLKTNQPDPSTSGNKIDWTATETTTTPPKKPFGNVGGVVGAIKPAPGLIKGKGKGKEKVAVPEKKEPDEDKNKEVVKPKDGKKGKGKENITPTESVASGSSGTPGKMSYAQMLSRS